MIHGGPRVEKGNELIISDLFLTFLDTNLKPQMGAMHINSAMQKSQ
jgi:hypothetical protein